MTKGVNNWLVNSSLGIFSEGQSPCSCVITPPFRQGFHAKKFQGVNTSALHFPARANLNGELCSVITPPFWQGFHVIKVVNSSSLLFLRTHINGVVWSHFHARAQLWSIDITWGVNTSATHCPAQGRSLLNWVLCDHTSVISELWYERQCDYLVCTFSPFQIFELWSSWWNIDEFARYGL